MSVKSPAKAQGTSKDVGFIPVVFPLDRNMPFSPSIKAGSSSRKGSSSLSYMERLQQKHNAMARIARDQPRSLSLSDQNTEVDNERVLLLSKKVREAWLNTDANSADGKYTFLAQLLRLNSTSGLDGRWSAVRTDLPPAEQLPGARWINAKTEVEWKEWEKRYETERRIKEKVEKWKKTVETPSTQPSFQDSLVSNSASARKGSKAASASILSVPADPLKNSTPFGFSVVKRVQKSAVGKPSGSGSGKATVPPEKPGDSASKPTKSSHNKHIAELGEHSFIPPSFPPSQLLTSTPKHAAKPSNPRKPDPIPHIAPPSTSENSILPDQPLSSPRVTKTYGRQHPSPSQPLEASASLPAIPVTPTRKRNPHNDINDDLNDDDSVFNLNKKRLLASPATPDSNTNKERALKRARTLSELQSSPVIPPPSNRRDNANVLRSPRTPITSKRSVLPPVANPPVAATSESSPDPLLEASPYHLGNSPKKQPAIEVPTLINLLASAKKGKKTSSSKPPSASKGKGKAKETTTLDAEDGVQGKELHSDVGDDVHEKPPAAPFLFPEAVVEDAVMTIAKDTAEQEPVHADVNDLPEREKDHHLFEPYGNSVVMAYEDPNLLPVDDAASPAKSLSSLAGSDSEDDEIENVDDGNNFLLSFNPVATSTQQHRGPFASSALRNELGANNVSAEKESQPPPNLSQMTKDSWESIYAPTSMPKSKSKASSSKSKSPVPQPQPRHYQIPKTDPVTSSNPFAYSSQLTSGVAKNVYDVDRLLEQDVELAYSGWIRDPYADEIEDADGFKDPESSP
ncbi:hypothetical protein JR316_0002960 [Psilocybe cubensis]|uniref:Uncharacterized protein n=2 Tax=Psilocybe cubensis TaxID=181762 RepID=A0ACB8H771_PSICU|nr:hypothetical protein JR316_0002960 [Psilocybe cubensis]KAH9483492.1 hypothetical protein JR316_0002960 [Psilocybe cubensis]